MQHTLQAQPKIKRLRQARLSENEMKTGVRIITRTCFRFYFSFHRRQKTVMSHIICYAFIFISQAYKNEPIYFLDLFSPDQYISPQRLMVVTLSVHIG